VLIESGMLREKSEMLPSETLEGKKLTELISVIFQFHAKRRIRHRIWHC